MSHSLQQRFPLPSLRAGRLASSGRRGWALGQAVLVSHSPLCSCFSAHLDRILGRDRPQARGAGGQDLSRVYNIFNL